jgi:hypothetical protein
MATALAESSLKLLVVRPMIKKQQMQWSKPHLLLQVRAAVPCGHLRERLTCKPPK